MADLESVPEVPDSINADKMSDEQLRAKLQRGYDEIDARRVHDAAAVFSSTEKLPENSLTGSETQTVSPARWDNRPRRTYVVNDYTPGERIGLLRTHLKLNVKEFAELVGYSRPYVSMVEHGKIEASEEFLKSVCAATDVTMGWLKGEDTGERLESEEEVLVKAFQYTEESRKAIRDRDLSEGKHLNGIPCSDLETLNEEERIKHQEMIVARGNRLRQLRKERAQSIRQCADIVPLSTSTVILVEGGKREMTKGLAKKLENAYDVSSKWLLYGDEISKDWPCSEKMIGYLERHPEMRKYVWEKMMEEERGQDLAGE